MNIVSAPPRRFQFTLLPAFAAMIGAAILLHGIVRCPDRVIHFGVSLLTTIAFFAIANRLARYDGHSVLDTTFQYLALSVMLVIGCVLAWATCFYGFVLIASVADPSLPS
jgi:hypothetical protein